MSHLEPEELAVIDVGDAIIAELAGLQCAYDSSSDLLEVVGDLLAEELPDWPPVDRVELVAEVLWQAEEALEDEISDAWSRLSELRVRQRWVTGALRECRDPHYLRRLEELDAELAED